MSFLEMLDVVNEELILKGEEPIAFDHDCREGICGTCSIAHTNCCVEAVERSMGVRPSPQTDILRNLTMYSLMIRDHALHLYFFVAPDIFGADSILELAEKEKEFVHQALHIKEAGNMMSKVIAGRAVHPIYYRIGGFIKVPSPDEVKAILAELKGIRDSVISHIELFRNCDFVFRRKTNYVAMVSNDYNFLDDYQQGHIDSTTGVSIPDTDYWNHLNRVVIPYSQATGFSFEGEDYMVGALARMNLNRQNLHRDTKRDASSAIGMFPSDNIYHNNLAQAIEMLHSIDRSIELLETTKFTPEPLTPITPKAGDGVGVIEAPRGTLYYLLSIKNDGTAHWGNIVIPTAQNQIRIEKDIALLLPLIMDKPKEAIQLEIEKLVRAYDPCMSCASHFLRINWV
jgi:coenzyme F420-reducing hydrogenase alpha subunit